MPEVVFSVVRLLGLLAVVYALLAVGAHFLSLRMIFPRPPLEYALTPDYIQLMTPAGVRLVARHWPNPQARFTLLYFHGNYEDLGSLAGYVPQFLQAGYAVLAYDYRGYGLSGGSPDEANTCADARVVYECLRTKLGVPADRIILWGYSLGGGPAVDLALHEPAAGLVLQGTFVSAYRVTTRVPVFPGDKFRNLAKAPRLRLPVLVIHGTADGTVPFWHGKALYDAVTARKERLFIEGGPHGGLPDYAGPRYWEELKKFTDSL